MIWMGWQKKMLWYIVTTLLSIFDSWVYYLTHGTNMVYTPLLALLEAGILVVPLFFLKDDKVIK